WVLPLRPGVEAGVVRSRGVLPAVDQPREVASPDMIARPAERVRILADPVDDVIAWIERPEPWLVTPVRGTDVVDDEDHVVCTGRAQGLHAVPEEAAEVGSRAAGAGRGTDLVFHFGIQRKEEGFGMGGPDMSAEAGQEAVRCAVCDLAPRQPRRLPVQVEQ